MLAPIRESYWQPHMHDESIVDAPKKEIGQGVLWALVLSVLVAIGLYSPARAETGQDYASQAGA